MRRSMGGACRVVGWGLALLLVPASGRAQSVESFYRGKTLSMVVGYPTGGSNDIYARSVARHIGKHIPGNPTVVPRNMPGAGSVVAMNNYANRASRDGTTVLIGTGQLLVRLLLGLDGARAKISDFLALVATPMGRMA